jgi:hypothetical protein
MILEAILLVAGMAIVLWGALKWIASTPRLLKKVSPCGGNWAEARIRHCEQGLSVTGIPAEPFNTWSNLAYLAAGWVTLRVLETRPAMVFAAAMALLCIGSSLYHGTKAIWASRVDQSGMYAVFAALAFYGIAPEHPDIGFVMGAGAFVMAIGFAFVFPGDLNARMGLLLLLLSARAFLLGSALLAGVSLGHFALAFALWNLDKRTAILGRFGHALWHVLTAAAMALMFMAIV